MGEVQAENKKLVEPLQKAQDQVSELQRHLFSYEKDKALLAVSKTSSFCFFFDGKGGEFVDNL